MKVDLHKIEVFSDQDWTYIKVLDFETFDYIEDYLTEKCGIEIYGHQDSTINENLSSDAHIILLDKKYKLSEIRKALMPISK